MKVTFRYDPSDAARVGEMVAALSAQGFNFEAEFLPVLPVPVQEERVQEPTVCQPDIYGLDDELPTELVKPEDYWKVRQVTLDQVIARALNYPPTAEEDPDEWSQENM